MQSENTVFVVDDDLHARDSLALLLGASRYRTETFESARAFLSRGVDSLKGVVIADIRMPDMDGLELQEELVRVGAPLAVIIVTGHADVPLAVRAMKAGAVDFLEKPFDEAALLTSIGRAFEAAKVSGAREQVNKEALERLALLTDREKQVLGLIVEGHPNKIIAYRLSISPRTVELHRARVMDKMGARNVAELVRMALPLVGVRKDDGDTR